MVRYLLSAYTVQLFPYSGLGFSQVRPRFSFNPAMIAQIFSNLIMFIF